MNIFNRNKVKTTIKTTFAIGISEYVSGGESINPPSFTNKNIEELIENLEKNKIVISHLKKLMK
ncbi:MAG: hypothetical protein Q7S27_05050 [Nanoarchaeota archaeon]|nr:hypothetical protein [Nanoarchaeota archaeon]